MALDRKEEGSGASSNQEENTFLWPKFLREHFKVFEPSHGVSVDLNDNIGDLQSAKLCRASRTDTTD